MPPKHMAACKGGGRAARSDPATGIQGRNNERPKSGIRSGLRELNGQEVVEVTGIGDRGIQSPL